MVGFGNVFQGLIQVIVETVRQPGCRDDLVDQRERPGFGEWLERLFGPKVFLDKVPKPLVVWVGGLVKPLPKIWLLFFQVNGLPFRVGVAEHVPLPIETGFAISHAVHVVNAQPLNCIGPMGCQLLKEKLETKPGSVGLELGNQPFQVVTVRQFCPLGKAIGRVR